MKYLPCITFIFLFFCSCTSSNTNTVERDSNGNRMIYLEKESDPFLNSTVHFDKDCKMIHTNNGICLRSFKDIATSKLIDFCGFCVTNTELEEERQIVNKESIIVEDKTVSDTVKYYPELIDYGKKYKFNEVWADDLNPYSNKTKYYSEGEVVITKDSLFIKIDKKKYLSTAIIEFKPDKVFDYAVDIRAENLEFCCFEKYNDHRKYSFTFIDNSNMMYYFNWDYIIDSYVNGK